MPKLDKFYPGLYCSTDGKTVVDLSMRLVNSDDTILYSFDIVLQNGKPSSVVMANTGYEFAQLYPHKIIACKVEKGATKRLKSVEPGLYCSEASKVVRVLSVSHYLVSFDCMFPIYNETIKRMFKKTFMDQYPIKITECVVE